MIFVRNKYKFALPLFLAACIALWALPALAESWRWTGGGLSGNVEMKVINSVRMVDAVQIANALGYKTEVQKGEDLLIRGGVGLRLANGAAAAWLGYGTVPLTARTRMESGGRFWIAADSAMDLFSRFLAKNGRNVKLQWSGKAVPEEEPAPEAKQPARSGSLPSAVGLRWGVPKPDTVRAVLDLDGKQTPKYAISQGKVTVTLDSLAESVTRGSKSFSDVKVSFRNGSPSEVEFTFSGRTASAFTLDNPRRLAIDFKHSDAPSSLVEANPDPAPAPKKSEKVEPVKPAPKPEKSAAPKGAARNGKKLVVIDAGHGGKDPGAVANGYQEKKIALEIATRLANELKKRGLNVKMTRSGDTYPSLRDRTTMANNWNADVFVSVHLNALPKGRHSKGVEIYLMALPTDKDAMELAKIENAEIADDASGSKMSDSRTEMLLSILGSMHQNAKIGESTALAEHLFNAGQSGKLNMKRVAQAPFWVLRGAAMPAVLIETGFITELSEVKQLAQPAYQQRMAEAFASGIAGFLNSRREGE